MMKKSNVFFNIMKLVAVIVVIVGVFMVTSDNTYATGILDGDEITATTEADKDSSNKITIGIAAGDGSDLASVLQILLVLTVIALAPSILIMLTSFTRIIIVMHFTRSALGTQSAPPNQVLVGLSLFLTFFIMWPTFEEINTTAIQPFEAGEITQEEAFAAAEIPLREFMYGETQEKDLKVFVDISGETYESYDDVPFTTLVPAFILT